jgi:hypothetical protein
LARGEAPSARASDPEQGGTDRGEAGDAATQVHRGESPPASERAHDADEHQGEQSEPDHPELGAELEQQSVGVVEVAVRSAHAVIAEFVRALPHAANRIRAQLQQGDSPQVVALAAGRGVAGRRGAGRLQARELVPLDAQLVGGVAVDRRPTARERRHHGHDQSGAGEPPYAPHRRTGRAQAGVEHRQQEAHYNAYADQCQQRAGRSGNVGAAHDSLAPGEGVIWREQPM